MSDQHIYISGDTEDIPEMRALKNIDIALICMNLPYTMTESSAASAVLEFKPKKVIPYHFRGRPKVSDIDLFESLITDSSIEVVRLDWYPTEDY
jgi:L-ascorbate metabolism protein UlaG (beta-lactamase superfamily)